MKLNKRILAILVLVVMALSLTACSSGSGSIVGVWKMDIDAILAMEGITKEAYPDEYDMMKSMMAGAEMTLEFTNDGRCIMKASVMGETTEEQSTYTLEGNTIYLDGEPGEYKISGNKLTLTEGGISLTLTRK